MLLTQTDDKYNNRLHFGGRRHLSMDCYQQNWQTPQLTQTHVNLGRTL